ncbi:MAG: family 2 glycosyl transferase [Berkelbacteria bacterium GW2011_GWE1_39_12]|uniref:Family 2 glycosyl transferase n=1 Tax=Berkelbacteria bacterium GW2011_GWE1_39_12 TaxID=1618337 RepID=A0A0G4B3M5_9BACT|nr:MAG: family 2 glycosyl transferase [Berkelbacteria bacterium GW2011_GWE1_39_12]
MTPKVSFITGVKNRASDLKEMIQSLIDQDMTEWEALIVDDHSDESIEAVVTGFHDDRLRFFQLPEGLNGVSCARNLAINHAQSDILLTADGDDVSRPQRARVTYDAMIKNRYDAFYSNLEYFSADNKKWTVDYQPFVADLLPMFNFITNPGTAYRKEVILEVGGFDPNFILSEDYDVWLRFLKAGAKFGYTEEILVNYRRGGGSISIQKFAQTHEYIQKARIKNNFPPINIEKAQNLATPEIAAAILSENGRKLWHDDRYKVSKEDK